MPEKDIKRYCTEIGRCLVILRYLLPSYETLFVTQLCIENYLPVNMSIFDFLVDYDVT